MGDHQRSESNHSQAASRGKIAAQTIDTHHEKVTQNAGIVLVLAPVKCMTLIQLFLELFLQIGRDLQLSDALNFLCKTVQEERERKTVVGTEEARWLGQEEKAP